MFTSTAVNKFTDTESDLQWVNLHCKQVLISLSLHGRRAHQKDGKHLLWMHQNCRCKSKPHSPGRKNGAVHSSERNELQRLVFMTQAEVWAKNWATFLGMSVLHLRLCWRTHQNLSENSFEFVAPCLVAELSEFDLHELRSAYWILFLHDYFGHHCTGIVIY